MHFIVAKKFQFLIKILKNIENIETIFFFFDYIDENLSYMRKSFS